MFSLLLESIITNETRLRRLKGAVMAVTIDSKIKFSVHIANALNIMQQQKPPQTTTALLNREIHH